MAAPCRITWRGTNLKSSQTALLKITMFTVLKSPPQSPDPNPIEHLWDVAEHEIPIMDVQPTCAGNVEMLSYLYGSKSLNLLLNVCHKELS